MEQDGGIALAVGIYWFVDDELKQSVTAADIQAFLTAHNNRPSSYGTTAMAPFDDSNPLNLVLTLGVGGSLPCASCGSCCSGARNTSLNGTTIHRRPWPEMSIHSITFKDDSDDDGFAATRRYRVLWCVLGLAGVVVAAWCFGAFRPPPPPEPDYRNQKIWLFEKHSDTLIYGTSMRDGNLSFNQSFGVSPFGRSPGAMFPGCALRACRRGQRKALGLTSSVCPLHPSWRLLGACCYFLDSFLKGSKCLILRCWMLVGTS